MRSIHGKLSLIPLPVIARRATLRRIELEGDEVERAAADRRH